MIKKEEDMAVKGKFHVLSEIVTIIQRTMESFNRTRAAQAAASVAYYALLSIFPFLLVFITLGSLFLENDRMYQEVFRLISQTLPVSPDLVVKNLEQIIERRGPVGLIGILFLIWSASSVFTTLAHNVNLAWPDAVRRNFFQKRLVGIGMIGPLFLLILLSLVVDVLVGLISSTRWILPGVFSPDSSILSIFMPALSSWLLLFLCFTGLYRWVPTSRVAWKPALLGSIFSATVWSIAVRLFSWYVNDIADLSSIYGSLGALVALMLLIYIFCTIALLGAHLASAIDYRQSQPA